MADEIKTPEEILRALSRPFPAGSVEWRVQQARRHYKSGKPIVRVIPYITARDVFGRFDEVVGPDNWESDITAVNGGFLATLTVQFPSDEIGTNYVRHTDGSEPTHIEAFKGGISTAIKRAAVHFGVGRYLYEIDAMYAKVHDDGQFGCWIDRDRKDWVNWDPPELPKWALPE